jgi:hypothetical protein
MEDLSLSHEAKIGLSSLGRQGAQRVKAGIFSIGQTVTPQNYSLPIVITGSQPEPGDSNEELIIFVPGKK